MDRLNTTTLSLAALACCTLFIACEPQAPAHNHVYLLDISGSAVHDLDARIADVGTHCLRTMGPQDAVTVLAIDNASETSADPLFHLDMAKQDFVEEALPLTVRQQVADQRRTAFVDSVLAVFAISLHEAVERRRASAKYTDIFGALQQARHQADPERVNHLTLFSDMVHESKGMDFHKLLKRGSDLREQLEQAPAMELPFEHVSVFTGDNAAMDAHHFRILRTFWQEWAVRNNVPLRTYTSGGARPATVLAQRP